MSWLVLIHQIPAKPDYLRVKVGRKLQRLGAVAIKNAVYVLPSSAEALEDLQWVLREVAEGGGEAFILDSRFVGGIDDGRIEDLFRAARDEECAPLLEETRALLDKPSAPEAEVVRLRRRLSEITAVDFFGSPRRLELEGLVASLAARLRAPVASSPVRKEEYRGRTWVTRQGIKVDRMASAWLIQRFIDPDASFRWVDGKAHQPTPGELRFDMFDAEFTHDGDLCTFEVLIRGFGLHQPGLGALAEIVHDIDLKDGKYGRPETAGVSALVDGIAAAHTEDDARLARAGAALDDWLALFAGRHSPSRSASTG